MSIVAGAICTKAADCSVAKSCCMTVNYKATGGGTESTSKFCVADKAAKGSTVKVTDTTANKASFDPSCSAYPCDGFLTTACAGVAAGANTLAVSAAVAATAVYMM